MAACTAYAQGIVRGRVVDAEKGSGLAGVSVFVNNTTIGTATDEAGQFSLSLPAGPQEVIFSSIGYETVRMSVRAGGDPLLVRMALKQNELDNITVGGYEKDGWKRYGLFFTGMFIGTVPGAALCTIRNPEVLRFRNDKAQNSLVVWASEPLRIENRALGYEVEYTLEDFQYSFRDRLLLYQGYPFFKPMKGTEGQKRRWNARRAEAYRGSMMHFMRAVYRNQLTEEGFALKRMERKNNDEKARIREAMRQKVLQTGRVNEVDKLFPYLPSDSLQHYREVLAQPDAFDILYNSPVTGDSIAFGIDAVTAGLEFSNMIQVTYLRSDVPDAYIKTTGKWAEHPVSRIYLSHGRPVTISADGSYHNPLDLMTEGYWSWAEKMANMLPFDYKKE